MLINQLRLDKVIVEIENGKSKHKISVRCWLRPFKRNRGAGGLFLHRSLRKASMAEKYWVSDSVVRAVEDTAMLVTPNPCIDRSSVGYGAKPALEILTRGFVNTEWLMMSE